MYIYAIALYIIYTATLHFNIYGAALYLVTYTEALKLFAQRGCNHLHSDIKLS